jgi:transcriptional regulator with XRE-family HTH domain
MVTMNIDVKNPHLGAIIREERKRRNLTQELLAQMAEVDVRTVQRAERDGSCGPESLMAIAEALDRDARDIITEAEERQRQEKARPKPPKDLIVRLEEAINGHELFATIKGSHASLQDFDTCIESRHLEQIGFVFDYLRDVGDIQDDVSPSHLIQFAEEVGASLETLRSEGILCFTGRYRDRLIFKNKPDDPLDWRVAIVAFRNANDSKVLADKNGRRFIVVTIPGQNRTPSP